MTRDLSELDRVYDPPVDVDASRLQAVLHSAFEASAADRLGDTLAIVVVHRGRLVGEHYAPASGPEQTQRSWSIAKSVLHAVVGHLIADGLLDLSAPAPVPAWSQPGDPRGAITVDHLLRMVDGLDFIEPYVEGQRCDTIEMLRDARTGDAAAYAEARPLAHPPGTVFNYSSGSSMVLSAIVKRVLGGGAERTEAYMRERVLNPIGMTSAIPRFDGAGTFLGSSYLFATPRDFARFGLLYLRDGVWNGRRALPDGWVDQGREPTPASGGAYGAHWWLNVAEPGTFCAKGFRGQYILVSPARDVVIVRLGVSTEEQREHVVETLGEMLRSFPKTSEQEAQ